MNYHIYFFSFLILLMSGCSNTKVYRICQYNGIVEDSVYSEFKVDVNGLIEKTMGEDANEDIVYFLENKKFVIIRATEKQHGELLSNWPSVACIGDYSESIGRERYESCIKYISAFESFPTVYPSEEQVLKTCSDDNRYSCDDMEKRDADAVLYCKLDSY
ncbi:TPA: hypothetical protein ACF3XN_003400 [Vibrio parahaemolyticus]